MVIPISPGSRSLPRLEPLERRIDVDHRNRKPDSRVVPFDAGDLAGSLRRERNEHPQHAPFDIDQGPAVVDRRDLGVGLHGFAPDAIEGADDPDRNAGRARRGSCPARSAHCPTRKLSAGAAGGPARFLASTLSSVSILTLSVATCMAASLRPSGSVTRIDAGRAAKLKALEMMYPSAETMMPVVGPVTVSTWPTRSSPPTVSMRTSDGETSCRCLLDRLLFFRVDARAGFGREEASPRQGETRKERREYSRAPQKICFAYVRHYSSLVVDFSYFPFVCFVVLLF